MARSKARVALPLLACSGLVLIIAFPSGDSSSRVTAAASVLATPAYAEASMVEPDSYDRKAPEVSLGTAGVVPAAGKEWSMTTAALLPKGEAAGADVDPELKASELIAAQTDFESDQSKIVHVGGRAVNLRTGPSSGHGKLLVLEPGQEIVVLEMERGWVRVATGAGEHGWVYSRYLNMDGITVGPDGR